MVKVSCEKGIFLAHQSELSVPWVVKRSFMTSARMVLLRLDPPHGILWPLHQIVVLWGLTHACPGESIKVIFEPTEAQPYWSAATVTNSLVCLSSSGSSNRIPVEKQFTANNCLTTKGCVGITTSCLWSLQTLCPVWKWWGFQHWSQCNKPDSCAGREQTWLLRRQRKSRAY